MAYRCSNCGKDGDSQSYACTCGAFGAFFRVSRKTKGPRSVRASEYTQTLMKRHPTGIASWDFLLGDPEIRRRGMVGGSSLLLGGDPGIGKTTSAMRVAGELAHSMGGDALYLSAEMPVHMVIAAGARGKARLGSIIIMYETRLEECLREISERQPVAIVWDSVQTFTAGKRSQEADQAETIRMAIESAAHEACLILISHSTKDGDFATPQSVAHLVDATMWLGSERVSVLKSRHSPSPRHVAHSDGPPPVERPEVKKAPKGRRHLRVAR